MKKLKTGLYVYQDGKRVEVLTEEEFNLMEQPSKKLDFVMLLAITAAIIAVGANFFILYSRL